MQIACEQPGRGGAHGSTEPSLDMGLDLESKLFEMAEAVARIEASMAQKEDLATLAQKLQSHIQIEDTWRKELDDRIAARRSWWQVIVAGAIGSGILTFLLELYKSSHH